MKKLLILMFFSALLCFTGCSARYNNLEELLTAPKLSQNQSDIVNALDSFVGDKITLKYPYQGENLSPFSFCDLNGDGIEEVVVTYIAKNNSPYIQIAILQKQNDSKWKVTQNITGLDTEIDKIFFSTPTHTDTNNFTNIIVGYQGRNTNEKTMAYYSSNEFEYYLYFQQIYYMFEVTDITLDNVDDVLLITAPSLQDNLQLYLFTSDNSSINTPKKTILDTNFSNVKNFHITKDYYNNNMVIIDGFISSNTLSTEVYYYENEGFIRWNNNSKNISELTTRNYININSEDIDKDGIIEIPIVEHLNINENNKFCLISYYEFNKDDYFEKSFGIYDFELNIFIPLPLMLKDTIQITNNNNHQWFVKDINSNKIHITIQFVYAEKSEYVSKNKDYQYILTIDEFDVYIKLNSNLSKTYKSTILDNVKKL